MRVWCSHSYKREREAMAAMPPEHQSRAMDKFLSVLPAIQVLGQQDRADRERKRAQQDLYIIHNPSSGLVKVGRSENIISRLGCLECSAGQVLSLIKVFKEKGFCEKACHERLSCWHRPPGKEWFEASPAEVLGVVEAVVHESVGPASEDLPEGVVAAAKTRLDEMFRAGHAREGKQMQLHKGASCTSESEAVKRKREEVTLTELECEAKRVRVHFAIDVATITLRALENLGLHVTAQDRINAKAIITAAAFGSDVA